MIFETIKSEGIAQKSYFIGSDGEAAIIDPRRDIDVYLEIAKRNNLQIKFVFETHRNEDYTIGSVELQQIVGAQIYHGSSLDFTYGKPVYDGDRFKLGRLELNILKTPGHTNESITITLKDYDTPNGFYLAFTGDALFAGETGRIDIYGESEKKKNAAQLYDSIFNKILPLGDQVIICPAHGAGSVCGAEIKEQELTTIGHEKNTNELLSYSQEEFIKYKISEKLYIPPYFQKMEELNREGPNFLGRIPELKMLKVEEFKRLMDDGAQVIDTREPSSFGGAHIPKTISIWSRGLPAFAGWMLNYHDPIIIIDEEGHSIDQISRYLIRLGYDNIYGYLGGGFSTWYMNAEPINKLELWSVHELYEKYDDPAIFLLDVREMKEWEEGHIKGSIPIYLGHLKDHLDEIPQDKKIIIYCDAGNKSTIAASVLHKNGYKDVVTVLGSIKAWKKAGYPIVRP
ncbi:MAG: MBL fold metallo-hydrolase [Methanobacterium sp.]|nr:MBL fold metallo-hydrolase [Methanobacterium sp.]